MNRLVLSCLSFLCCALCGVAQNTDSFSSDVMAISYDDDSGVESSDGTGKAEHYDVAIFLDDASLFGKSVVGVRIPFVSVEDLSNLKVWVSTTLALTEESLPQCDVLEISGDMSEGWTEISFADPVDFGSDGLYIGYSFDVDKINSNNLKPICLTSVASQKGYFIHTSRTTKYKNWTNANESSDVGSLRLQVMVKGMDPNAASIEVYPKINVQLGTVANVPVRIKSHGYNGVSSIEYDFEINGLKGHNNYILETPIAAVYNKYADVEIPLCEVNELGQQPFTIDLLKVNGAENTDNSRTSEGTLNVFDFVPVHRPLFEEYTGAWCGNCPRGIAAIETMKELHPDDFICISYHNSDAMEITSSFPSEIRGFPDSWISRRKRTDPFFGDKNDGQFHLEEEWEIIRKEPTNMSVDVEAEWGDEEETAIDVTVKIMSQIAFDADDLAIGCALVADDLHGDDSGWWQNNYYAGKSETCAPELQWIAEKPKTITDLHFNDVLILGQNLDGLDANLPDGVEPMNEYEVTFKLCLQDAVSTAGVNLVQDKSKLRVVAMAIDRNSTEILNSNQTDWMQSAGISDMEVESEISVVDYYDLFGYKVDPHVKGVILKVVNYIDGSKKCNKVINM